MDHTFPKRKTTRLRGYDYNSKGACFLTICTKDRKCILSKIEPFDQAISDMPSTVLTPYGKTVEKVLGQMNKHYEHLSVDHYVIMPNHVHILLQILVDGPSGTPVPTEKTVTPQNTYVAKFVSAFKRFCNREYGRNVWQARSFDHVIRGKEDYEIHRTYIYENPLKWQYDEMYTDQ